VNPWAFIAIAVGILVIIIGVKGSQHHVASALTGKTTSQTAASGTGAKGPGVALA
jgi:hypothetical protein